MLYNPDDIKTLSARERDQYDHILHLVLRRTLFELSRSTGVRRISEAVRAIEDLQSLVLRRAVIMWEPWQHDGSPAGRTFPARVLTCLADLEDINNWIVGGKVTLYLVLLDAPDKHFTLGWSFANGIDLTAIGSAVFKIVEQRLVAPYM